MPQPLNFDLQIEANQDGYRSRVIHSPVGEASSEFDLPFTQAELVRFLAPGGAAFRQIHYVSAGMGDDPFTPQNLGEQLYAAAFAGDVGISLLRSLDEAKRQQTTLRIRLRFDPAASQLSSLPWEYLYATPLNRFLALSDDTSLVRYSELPQTPKPVGVSLPVRVLGVVSDPSDAPQLNVEAEWTHLSSALAPLQERGLVEVERLERPTILALQDRLRRGDVHILHFIGHGSFDDESDQGGLYFENEQGQSHWVDARRLGTLLHDQDGLSLLFLNACEGAQTSHANLWAGTAQQLVQQGIPAVLAMQFAVTDGAAITLARTFYGATADGYSIDAAVAEARKAVYLGGSEHEWATPVLFSRSPDNRLFEFPDDKTQTDVSDQPSLSTGSAAVPAMRQASSRSRLKPVLIGGGVIAVLVALLFIAQQLFFPSQVADPPPAPPVQSATSQANAAVIVEPTPTLSPLCADDRQCVLLAKFDPPEDELSAEVLRKIQAELTNGELLPPDIFNVQIVDAIQDADQVRKLSAQEHAEIVIWGQIFQQFEELNINFELTNQLGVGQSNQLRPYRVQSFESVAQQLTCAEDCFAPANLRKVLDQLGEVVAHMAAGMLHYGLGQAEEADQDFGVALYCIGEPVDERSLNLTSVNCARDLDIAGFNAGALYYYAGRAKILTGDYATALAYLQEAAELNSDDPAPLIGVATVYQSWIDQGDISMVDDALDEAVLRSNTLRTEMVNRNASPKKIAAVDYELGFIAELQKDWETAERKYTLAIEEFGPESPEAYVSHIALARVQRSAGKTDDAEATLQQAKDLDPGAPWALLELAQLHGNDRPTAEPFLESARRIAPNQPYVDIVTAQLCAEWGDYACAEEAYQRAQERRPNSGWLLGRIGDFYQPSAEPLPHQDWSKAAEYYGKAVQRRPNDPWAHERLAFAEFYQEDYAGAAEEFAISLHELSHPQTQVAERYCTLAQAQQAAGVVDDALSNYQTCLDGLEDPDMRTAIEALIEPLLE